MMILIDFYLAFAIVLVAIAGLLVAWQIDSKRDSNHLRVMAAILFALGGMAGIGSLVYYGNHLMHKGECPYSEPLVPCPTTQSNPSMPHPSHAPADTHQDESVPKLEYQRIKPEGLTT